MCRRAAREGVVPGFDVDEDVGELAVADDVLLGEVVAGVMEQAGSMDMSMAMRGGGVPVKWTDADQRCPAVAGSTAGGGLRCLSPRCRKARRRACSRR